MTSRNINATVSQYAPAVQKPNFSLGFTPYRGAFAKEAIDSNPTGGGTTSVKVVEDLTAIQDNKSYRISFTGGTDNHDVGISTGIIPNTLRYGILNIQVVIKVPANFDFTAAGYHLKFLRFKTETSAAVNRGYADIYIKPSGDMFYIHEAIASSYVDATAGYAIQRDVWETIEYRVVFDSVSKDAGGEGRATLWIKRGNDFIKIIDQTSKPTLFAADDKNPLALLFTYWNGNAPKDQSLQMQRMVIETDQSKMFAVADGMKIIGGEYVNA